MLFENEKSVEVSSFDITEFMLTGDKSYKPVVKYSFSDWEWVAKTHTKLKKDKCLTFRQEVFRTLFDVWARCDELNIKRIAIVISELELISPTTLLHIIYHSIKRYKAVNFDSKIKEIKVFYMTDSNGNLSKADRNYGKQLPEVVVCQRWDN